MSCQASVQLHDASHHNFGIYEKYYIHIYIYIYMHPQEKVRAHTHTQLIPMLRPAFSPLSHIANARKKSKPVVCRISRSPIFFLPRGDLNRFQTRLGLRGAIRTMVGHDFRGRLVVIQLGPHMVIWLWLEKTVPKWNPGKWKHGPKPA